MLLCVSYIYRPKRSCGKVMFLHLCVSHSVPVGCLPLVRGVCHTPPGQTPPVQYRLGYTPSCGQRSTSGRYASHWNASLFRSFFVTFQQYQFYGNFPIDNVARGKPVTIEPSDGTCGSTPQRSTIMRPLRGGVQNVRRHYSLSLTGFQEHYCITFQILTAARDVLFR